MNKKIYAEENLALVIQYSLENLERSIKKKLDSPEQFIAFLPQEFIEEDEKGELKLNSKGRKESHNIILRYFNFNAFAKYSPDNVVNAMIMAIINKRNKNSENEEELNHAFAGLPIQTIQRLNKISADELKRREAFAALFKDDSSQEDKRDTENE